MHNPIIDNLKQTRAGGKKIIGCFPLYPPLALLHAMDMVPVVLWGLKDSADGTEKSDRHLQNFTCSIARHLTEFVLTEGGELLDGIFMYNACDTLRNLPEILSTGVDLVKGTTRGSLPVVRMHLPMVPPSQTDTSSYFKNEINALVDRLEAVFEVSFSGEKFEKSTALYRKSRQLCNALDQYVSEGKMRFREFADLMSGIGFLPVEQQIHVLESALSESSNSPGSSQSRRVILSGIMPPPASVLDAIENADLAVAGNDIASLGRSNAPLPEITSDPVEYYSDFYYHHFPCPTLLYTGEQRMAALELLAKENNAGGMIFVGEKFCEYEFFEFPYVEAQLRKKGIQTLLVEVAMDDMAHTSALHTRIEAFAEMMESPTGET